MKTPQMAFDFKAPDAVSSKPIVQLKSPFKPPGPTPALLRTGKPTPPSKPIKLMVGMLLRDFSTGSEVKLVSVGPRFIKYLIKKGKAFDPVPRDFARLAFELQVSEGYLTPVTTVATIHI